MGPRAPPSRLPVALVYVFAEIYERAIQVEPGEPGPKLRRTQTRQSTSNYVTRNYAADEQAGHPQIRRRPGPNVILRIARKPASGKNGSPSEPKTDTEGVKST